MIFKLTPPRILLLAFAAILLAHVIWEIQNDTPPVWDMAYHEQKGQDYLLAWRTGHFAEQFSRISSHYPPLYYLQEAVVLAFFPQTEFLPLLANSIAMFLLAYCTFGIASFFLPSSLAVCAGVLTLLFPFMAWISRTSLLDLPLAGWAAAAGYCVLKSNFFLRRGWTIAFGLACAAGILTKWTFPVYLLFPLLYGLLRSEDKKKAFLNLADASIVAVPLIFSWYLPNLSHLFNRYPTTAQTSLIPWLPDPRHGEPGLASILGWIYYPRVLSNYYLFFPLTMLFIWGAVSSAKDQVRNVGFLWWWLLGTLMLLILMTPKDPRFASPLAVPVAVLLIVFWKDRTRVVYAISLLAVLQFLTVSFKSPLHPLKIAFFETHDTNYQSLQREWVLYETNYFGVAGPPTRENWNYEAIIKAVPPSAKIGFLPDMAYFHPNALRVLACRKGRQLDVVRLGETKESLDVLPSVTVVIGKTGAQGISYITRFNDQVYKRLEELGWPLVGTWELPDRSRAMLWQNPTALPE